MAIEIERKYLVHHDKWQQYPKGKGQFYRQGYMLTDPSKTVRLRLTDTEGFITIKGLSVGPSRTEYEYAIPREDARELLDKFCTSDITKLRYKVYEGGRLWEVDEFLDKNEGLILAEIELSHEDEAFVLPEWVDKEVTGDEKYYNANLSHHPFSQWEG